MSLDESEILSLGLNEAKSLIENLQVTQVDLHRYAWASGDHNPIHFNNIEAQKSGLPGVIAHGMYTLAIMNRGLENLIENIHTITSRKYKVVTMDTRFVGMLELNNSLSVHAKIQRQKDNKIYLSLSAFKNSNKDHLVCTSNVCLE